MFAGQIQPQAQSPTRPAPSAKLLHCTEPVFPQRLNRKLPGRLQAWIPRAQSKSRQVRTRRRSARADHRARRSAVLHTPAPLLWCTSYLLTPSPRDPPQPCRPEPEPASPGVQITNRRNSRQDAALKKGGATEKPSSGGALARSLRAPSALLKFSRESSSRGLRLAFCIFTFLFFSPLLW